jgi:hypothetical protein
MPGEEKNYLKFKLFSQNKFYDKDYIGFLQFFMSAQEQSPNF